MGLKRVLGAGDAAWLVAGNMIGAGIFITPGIVAGYLPGVIWPLVAWLLWFHLADAAQVMSAFVLRAHRIATVPLIIYAAASWGVGLGGGYAIAFDVGGFTPAALHGARGFWFASTSGLVLAAAALTLFLMWVLKRERAG